MMMQPSPPKILKAAAPILKALDAPPVQPPAKAIAMLEQRLAEKIPAIQELTMEQMRALILKFIGERPSDGFDLIKLLEERKFRLKDAGEGVIYGLLSQLESGGCLEGRWREQGSRMVKTYHLTDKGGDSLKGEGSIHQINVWLGMLLKPKSV